MAQNRGLSKSRIIAHRQCPKRLWLKSYRPDLEEVDDESQARMASGTRAGEIAQSLFPKGILIDREDMEKALIDTQKALGQKPRRPIFEAGFRANGILVFIDLLLPSNKGYRLAEVKSSTGIKDYHYEDAAIQTWVVEEAGISISKVEIAHIDNTFVYQGDGEYKGLFTFAGITKDIRPLVSQVPKWAAEARKTLSGDEPNVSVGDHCHDPFDCPFIKYCAPQSDDAESGYPPETLSYGRKLAATLRMEGYNDLRDVPEDRLEKPKHKRQRRAALNSKPELDPEAGEMIRNLPFPRFYLDFETISLAMPIWRGTRPYQKIPFQWSCHSEMEDGTVTHRYFLTDGLNDPRKAFVDSMLTALGEHGPIFAYKASFEIGRIKELAEAFPQIAKPLLAIVNRIIDLLPIARAHYYHQDMHGSWSLKNVIPTIAPDLRYDEMDVGDGGAAESAFREILDPATAHDRKDFLRRALLEYCERDTLALVKMAHYFQKGDI